MHVIFLFLCELLLPLLKAGRRRSGLAALMLVCAGQAMAQVPKPAAAPAPAKSAATQPAEPQAIPLSDVAVQVEVALSQVRRLDSTSRVDATLDQVDRELPTLTRLAAIRNAETQHLLRQNAALDTIRGLEEGWRDVEVHADDLTQNLTRAASQLDRDLDALNKLEATWNATSALAKASSAPSAVTERIQEVSNAIATTKRRVLDKRATVLATQSKTAELGARSGDAMQMLSDAYERAVSRLFYRDSNPMWARSVWSASVDSISPEASDNLFGQVDALFDYTRAQGRNFLFHGLFFFGVYALLALARSKIQQAGEGESGLRRAKRVFDMPLVSALLIALLFSSWFYPRPPRSLWILISVIGALPVMLFARRVIESYLYPVLYAIIGFYLADKLRLLLAPLPGVPRIAFLVETVLLAGFLIWVLRFSRHDPASPDWAATTAWRVIRAGTRLTLAIVVGSLVANVFGYVRLSDLTVSTALESAFTALVLYALVRVGEGLVQGALHLPPIIYLGMVQKHRPILQRRLNRWLKVIAILLWVALTLQIPGLLQPVIGLVRSAWDASVSIGSLKPTLGDAVNFLFVIWVSFSVSRLARFVLEEEIFPKLRLERGLPYAISTMLHYAILLTGLVIALGAIGVDMTKFTIVAGAFSVGIGFGLQNIVNNFVSGLIVLFERPVKVGDTIQVDDMVGRVQHIGIRASVILSTTGAEVIIPNGKLISDKVINWTLSNKLRQISIPVTTKSDVDVTQLRSLLIEIAQNHKSVVDNPAPEALFVKRGIDVFDFELRVWTAELDAWLEVKSDLITAINDALRAHEMLGKEPPAVPLILQ